MTDKGCKTGRESETEFLKIYSLKSFSKIYVLLFTAVLTSVSTISRRVNFFLV